MRVYVFAENSRLLNDRQHWPEKIRSVVEQVAARTDDDDLVVAAYLKNGSATWGGEYLQEWLEPADLHQRANGEWQCAKLSALLADIPKRFKLIRMVFGTSARYPKTAEDSYGWKMRLETFEDHVASLFAHELHHYRRYHLGLHPGEGEQSACKWALMRAKEVGFSVEAVRVRRRRRKPQKTARAPSKKNPDLVRRAKLRLSHLTVDDLQEVIAWAETRITHLESQAKLQRIGVHLEILRGLPNGSSVRITRGEARTSPYIGQTAVKTGTLKRNSRRLPIRTQDGKTWRWPMAWLEPAGSIEYPAACKRSDHDEPIAQ